MREALDKGTEVDDTEGSTVGMTALMAAARAGQLQAAKLLIAAGAALDRPCRNGETPLMKAAIAGRGPLMRLLTEAGAALEYRNPVGAREQKRG